MGRTPRWVLLIVAALATIALLAGFARESTATAWAATTTQSVKAASENGFVRKINADRTRRGQGALKVDLQLTRVARRWSGQMASETRMYHNPKLGSQVSGDWTRLGENVGYSRKGGATQTELVARLHTAFMNSPSHRANILGDYNRVGVGVRVAADGTMWVTVNFAKASGLSNTAVTRAAAVARRQFVAPTMTGRRARLALVLPSHTSATTLDRLRTQSGPLLLTHRGTQVDPNPVLHPLSRAEVDRVLRAGATVYLVGAVSDRVASELASDGYTVRRVSTAAAAAL